MPIHVEHWGGLFAYFTYFLSILNIGGDAARSTFVSFVSYVRLPLAIRLSGESSSGQDVHFEQLLVLASSKYKY